MSKTMCPGQDTRYWRPGDIFEIECRNCGKTVEFFKDDTSRKCASCGTRIKNPRLSLGCARWCEHAAECLGYDPKAVETESTGYDPSLTESISASIKNLFGAESCQYQKALAALEHARDLIKTDSADPGIVFPAVLLLEAGSVNAEEILKEQNLTGENIDNVLSIIHHYNRKEAMNSNEFSIVSESHDLLDRCH